MEERRAALALDGAKPRPHTGSDGTKPRLHTNFGIALRRWLQKAWRNLGQNPAGRTCAGGRRTI